MEPPRTEYARSGDVSIAYQVLGDGPFDLVVVPGSVSNVELLWDDPPRSTFVAGMGAFMRRLASFARVITFDKRGTGASDRTGVATLETRMDDLRAVMDAAGSERAAILGVSEGGPMSLLFASTYPDRVPALVVYGALPRFTRAPDWPWGDDPDEAARRADGWARAWGTEEAATAFLHAAQEPLTPENVRGVAAWQRLSASPGAIVNLARMNRDIDVRPVLPTVRVPTLVLHRGGDPLPVEGARAMAAAIPGARFVELPGAIHFPNCGDSESVIREIESFTRGVHATGGWEPQEPDRLLATILFTDIVGSTEKAVQLGDRGWRDLVARHHELVRLQLARFRGRELDTAGDGFFAAFDGPARAIRCATAITGSVRELGIEVRAGLHTGECELFDGKISGIAVNIGARVAARAEAGEVLVSSTVRDLVAGSGLAFSDRGAAELKGIPGEWRLYALADGGAG